jgi:hypothetical protein
MELGLVVHQQTVFPRPLDQGEQELVEALLGAARAGAGRYLGQLEKVEVVGGCRCGCPSIDLAIPSGPRDGAPTPLVLADAESPEGVPVGVILWVCGGALSGLEIHPWDGADGVGLPYPETLTNLRTGGD